MHTIESLVNLNTNEKFKKGKYIESLWSYLTFVVASGPYQNAVILNSCEKIDNNRKYELNVTLNTDLNVMLCFNKHSQPLWCH